MRLTPARLALIYIIASGMWVVASSELVFFELRTPEAISRWEIAKGIAFIVASGTLIYAITKRLVDRIQESEEKLKISEVEAKLTEEQLRQSQRVEALGRLARGIAHDFNSILNVIASSVYLLNTEISTERAKSRLSAITGATERAAILIRQLLAFSNRQVLDPKPLNLNLIVQQTGELMQRLLGTEIKLELTLQSCPWNVLADANQITQVLVNLCLNARDAMPHGGTISIQTKNVITTDNMVTKPFRSASGPKMLVTVADTGSGMTPGVLERIFEPFFTTKEPGKGTGLGLSIVFDVVMESGGFITVDSELGKGTVFHLYFPTVEHLAGSATLQPTQEPCLERPL
jgi:two-component system cell cycle sensor histidine kinase/response regulator CckA